MEDGAPDQEGVCAAIEGASCTTGGPSNLGICNTKSDGGSPMVEDCSIRSDDVSKLESCGTKGDAISFAMDVASPNSKMEVGSPNMEVTSPTMEVNSPPTMDVSSPKMDVASPKMEEGSAKMEEVAVKMGEVSVKSEDISSKCKDSINEQGSSKMEEVAVKMGEVSVKSERCPVKCEGTTKSEGNTEIRTQIYRGTKCITEGEVPEWLTVDIIVRAIYNDRPGTKKPLIRPFGSDSKTRTQGQSTSKSHSFSRENTFARSVTGQGVNRSSNSNMLSEPSSSQSLNRPATSQSPGKPSTSQSGSKPSTSQSSSNRQSTSQTSSNPSSSTSSDRPTGAAVNNSGKGKSSGGRIKGKSSVSLYKGKAPASEAASRASMQLENKNVCISTESGSSVEMDSRLADKNSENKTSEEDGTVNCISSESSVSSDNQGDVENTESSAPVDHSMGHVSRNDEDEDASGEGFVNRSATHDEVTSPDGSTNNFSVDKSESCDYNAKNELPEMFKKPTDPPKRSLKKPGVSSKGLGKQHEDTSQETFKKPGDPPKRNLKITSDLSKEMAQSQTDSLKVSFKEPNLPPDGVQEVSHETKDMVVCPGDSSKSTFDNQPGAKHSGNKSGGPPKKPQQPPLRVIRFISQRLSSGNTVYRVRATAVRGSIARDCHLVVKLCSNNAEINYYKRVAPRIPYVPRVLLCHNNIVVMDDLIHEGFRRPRGNFTPAQMTVAIDGLARMHTASVIALKCDPSLLEAFPQSSKASESDIARDLRTLADRVKSWSISDADYYATRCRALAECVPYMMERLEPSDTNMTVLLHGNVSPRNVFFLYDSRNPRLPAMASFVDFSHVYWGHPALDVSLVTGPAGGFWEGYKIVLMSLLTRASGRMWLPQPEVKDCGETYAFALLRAVCSSVSGPAAKVLEAKLHELFPVFRQYSWLDFW